MPPARTRRRLLVLAGGAVSTLAGCSNAVSDLAGSSRDEAATSTEKSSQSPSPERTGTDETDHGDPTGSEPSTTPLDLEPPDHSFADAPMPETPGDHRYATMGRPSDSPTAVLFGSWKCPFTREFVVTQLDGIVEEFVRPGEIALRFRDIAYRSGEPFLGPDAPRAGRAGLGVWQADPRRYWAFFAYVFANQPPEREAWATEDALLTFADAAGIDETEAVEEAIRGTRFESALLATRSRADELDLRAVPRIVLGGEVTAPTVDRESTRAQFEAVAGR